MTAWSLFAPIWFAELVVLGAKCTDHDCSSVARWTTFWPGQTGAKCDAHRDAWSRVARHMGFELACAPLAVREWPEPDPRAQWAAAIELT